MRVMGISATGSNFKAVDRGSSLINWCQPALAPLNNPAHNAEHHKHRQKTGIRLR